MKKRDLSIELYTTSQNRASYSVHQPSSQTGNYQNLQGFIV